ncbi:uncharacterized protein LOC129593993 isoform X2 [Paramacrobiotus metropolitanus]|uniref:uncharacterized protein LOC129593993 isoform X2 n=1 Tax=Paramacrobiotus metropolitanus TaxID=2943436 RepID=UPI0024462DDF|nr:uncharacterized protein LOC129593993 isoform X2 [Paramacrobiotus metropolitanus]
MTRSRDSDDDETDSVLNRTKRKTETEEQAEDHPEFSERQDETGNFETFVILKNKKKNRKLFANFVLHLDYLLICQSEPARGGWRVTVVSSSARKQIVLAVPSSNLANAEAFERYLRTDAELAARGVAISERKYYKEYIMQKQKEFYVKHGQSLDKNIVKKLGMQHDGRTIILGPNSIGTYTGDDESMEYHPSTFPGSQFYWDNSVGLPDFAAKFGGHGSEMFLLIKENFSSDFALKFCSLLGAVLEPLHDSMIRNDLSLAVPVLCIFGDTRCFKSKMCEWASSILGYLNDKIVNQIHDFAVFCFDLDPDTMVKMELRVKQSFDGGSSVTNNGIKDAGNPLIFCSNKKPMHAFLNGIEESTRERLVLFEQPNPLRDGIVFTQELKTKFNEARRNFSNNLTVLANPASNNPIKRILKHHFEDFRSRFTDILAESGLGLQRYRLAESYALYAALGTAIYHTLDASSGGTTSIETIKSMYTKYFQNFQCRTILQIQLSNEPSLDSPFGGVASHFVELMVAYMQIKQDWHKALTWPVKNNSLEKECVGVRLTHVYAFLKIKEAVNEVLAPLLKKCPEEAMELWCSGTVNGRKKTLASTVNGFCDGIPYHGRLIPLEYFSSSWILVENEASRQNHIPKELKCFSTKQAQKRANSKALPITGAEESEKTGTPKESDTSGASDPAPRQPDLNDDSGTPAAQCNGNGAVLKSSSTATTTNTLVPRQPDLNAGSDAFVAECSGNSTVSRLSAQETVCPPKLPASELVVADDIAKTMEIFGLGDNAATTCSTSVIPNGRRVLRKPMQSSSEIVTPKEKEQRKAVCGVCERTKPGSARKAGAMLLCRKCLKWIHKICTGLSSADYELYSTGNMKGSYTCANC